MSLEDQLHVKVGQLLSQTLQDLPERTKAPTT